MRVNFMDLVREGEKLSDELKEYVHVSVECYIHYPSKGSIRYGVYHASGPCTETFATFEDAMARIKKLRCDTIFRCDAIFIEEDDNDQTDKS